MRLGRDRSGGCDGSGAWRARRPANDRGQAHTLEGVVASLVLLSAIVFALEMTAVTPLSASTSSQHIENQQEATARGVLGAAAESGALKRTLLFWNDSSGQFFNTSRQGYYSSGPPPTDFGAMLNRSFDREGVAYNIYLRYQHPETSRKTKTLVYQGVPSDNAVSASWSVALFQDDKLYDHEEQRTSLSVSEANYFAGDTTDSSVHNVIHVEVVVWRI